MNFTDITVVGIHGNDGIEGEIPAVINNMSALPGSKGLLITNKLVTTHIPQKLVYQNMGHLEVSDFIIYSLFQYIDTKFALITQSDGWILNSENWRDDFFNYDFIGGTTHAAYCPDDESYRINYSWIGQKNPIRVQNGGLSLRSRRFLEAPTKYGITKRYLEPFFNNEDIQICCWMRPALESIGLKFAPNEISMYFSIEHLSPILHCDLDLKKVLGHHSKYRKLIGNKKIIWGMPKEIFEKIPMENKIYELFEYYQYDIKKINQ